MPFGEKVKRINVQVEKMINRVQSAAPNVQLDYFFSLWADVLSVTAKGEQLYIAVMDENIPELYIRACGAVTFLLFAGKVVMLVFLGLLSSLVCSRQLNMQFMWNWKTPKI